MSTSAEWNDTLKNAFGRLLGRPLEEFKRDATYAFFFWDDILSSEFFGEGINAEAMTEVAQAAPASDFDDGDEGLGWNRFGFDLADSEFAFEDGEISNEAAAEALQAIAEERDEMFWVRGAALGALVRSGELDSDALGDEYLSVNIRVRSDGSLFDALRAATWTHGGPDNLLDFEGGSVEEPWAERLADVGHARLRDHLRMLCLDAHSARCDGAYFHGAQCPGELEGLAEKPGWRVIAGWSLGEGQAACAVFEIDESA